MAIKPEDILHDRYRVIKTIGQGGMGSIFLANDLRLEGRQCAIKEVTGDTDASPEIKRQSREQFYREASTLARLDHPSLPKVSDFFSDGDTDFLSAYLVVHLIQRLNRQASDRLSHHIGVCVEGSNDVEPVRRESRVA